MEAQEWTPERFSAVLPERIWSRFILEDSPEGFDTPCWIWTGSLNKKYPQARFNGRNRGLHRLLWELHHNEIIPSHLDADHLCLRPSCANPLHITPCDPATNRAKAPQPGRPRQTHCSRGHELRQGSKRQYCPICNNRSALVTERLEPDQIQPGSRQVSDLPDKSWPARQALVARRFATKRLIAEYQARYNELTAEAATGGWRQGEAAG